MQSIQAGLKPHLYGSGHVVVTLPSIQSSHCSDDTVDILRSSKNINTG